LDTHGHWNSVYTTKGERDVSWFEFLPTESLRMLEASGLTKNSCVIDVGSGDSRLVDQLVVRGLTCIAVLDVSEAALLRAQARLGEISKTLTWIASDVTAEWSVEPMDFWHDRAVFHFLVDPRDRALYVQRLRQTLKLGGTAIIATFAPDGPPSCSGLPVARYSPETLAAELGDEFTLIDSTAHLHHTPWGATQSFQYSRLECRADAPRPRVECLGGERQRR
jgi:SAM-dependent methyltransferase